MNSAAASALNEQGDRVDAPVEARGVREPLLEREDEQEREEHLYAGQRDADLVEELDQLAIDPLPCFASCSSGMTRQGYAS